MKYVGRELFVWVKAGEGGGGGGGEAEGSWI